MFQREQGAEGDDAAGNRCDSGFPQTGRIRAVSEMAGDRNDSGSQVGDRSGPGWYDAPDQVLGASQPSGFWGDSSRIRRGAKAGGKGGWRKPTTDTTSPSPCSQCKGFHLDTRSCPNPLARQDPKYSMRDGGTLCDWKRLNPMRRVGPLAPAPSAAVVCRASW